MKKKYPSLAFATSGVILSAKYAMPAGGRF